MRTAAPAMRSGAPGAAGPLLPALLLAVASCAGDERAPLREARFFAFGTVIELVLWEPDEERARRAERFVAAELTRLHEAWHPWRPSGELAEINRRLSAGQSATAGPRMRGLLLAAAAGYERSGGLFNPTLGRLVELWNFHDEELPGRRPPPERLSQLLQDLPGMEDLQLEGATLRSGNRHLLLDFGGIAKGYALDRIVIRLKEMGVQNAILTAGGDLRAIGRRGDRHWRIGIRHPRGRGIMAALEVRDGESVFTSGDYERFFFGKEDGEDGEDGAAGRGEERRYHHILDPRTGYPARGTVSVTVVHASAAMADAAATALFVAGPERWRQTAQAMEVDHVLLVDEEGRVFLSDALAGRLQPELGERLPL